MAVKEPQPAALHALLQDQALSSSIKPGLCPTALPELNSRLLEHIKSLNFSFVISDAQHPDMPIVFASDGFYTTTGYSPAEVRSLNCSCRSCSCMQQKAHTSREARAAVSDAVRVVVMQVIGRNCRFLQGPETERQKVCGGAAWVHGTASFVVEGSQQATASGWLVLHIQSGCSIQPAWGVSCWWAGLLFACLCMVVVVVVLVVVVGGGDSH